MKNTQITGLRDQLNLCKLSKGCGQVFQHVLKLWQVLTNKMDNFHLMSIFYRMDHLLCIVFSSIRPITLISTEQYGKNVNFWSINDPFPIWFDISAGAWGEYINYPDLYHSKVSIKLAIQISTQLNSTVYLMDKISLQEAALLDGQHDGQGAVRGLRSDRHFRGQLLEEKKY